MAVVVENIYDPTSPGSNQHTGNTERQNRADVRLALNTAQHCKTSTLLHKEIHNESSS
jgi:hypothetical protein